MQISDDMKHFTIALISIVLHKAITQALSISYNFLTAPLDAGRLAADLLAFAAVYAAVAFAYKVVSSPAGE